MATEVVLETESMDNDINYFEERMVFVLNRIQNIASKPEPRAK
jgi:hypothetical protein